jgi:hypothetical protein
VLPDLPLAVPKFREYVSESTDVSLFSQAGRLLQKLLVFLIKFTVLLPFQWVSYNNEPLLGVSEYVLPVAALSILI